MTNDEPAVLIDVDEYDEDDFWVGPPDQHLQVGLLRGDCLVLLKTLDANSVDSIVTDPPYELGFMGKSWDNSGIAYNVALWVEALRVLKPGGHLLAFGGSRTYHRIASSIEDAGFEIRDQIMWLYGSGFPKSMDVSKAIDKSAGVEFTSKPASGVGFMNPDGAGGYNNTNNQLTRKGESTPDAQKWQGWGTALKPAHEPIVVARKPLVGTVVKNVLEYGTGALNIDASRVLIESKDDSIYAKNPHTVGTIGANGVYSKGAATRYELPEGRWPANIIHDGSDEVLNAFPSVKPSRKGKPRSGANGKGWGMTATGTEYNDDGSAARFFYCAKASKSERSAGVEDKNHHPTVKPLALMRYLINLVTPPGGKVLDPFLGSGTTAAAAILEGFEWVGCEITEDYYPIIEGRIAQAADPQH
jgi:site-specific DNA-methyltransferase (adenine-specific)